MKAAIARLDEAHRRHRAIAIPVAVLRKFSDDRGGNWTAVITLFGFFSLFPLLMVFVTILGFVIQGHPDLQRQVLGSALAQFPIIGGQLQRNVHALTGSTLTLALGLATAIWSGMRVVTGLEDAMDELWNVPRRDRPGFLRSRLRALLALVALGTAALAAGFLAGLSATGGWSVALRVLTIAATIGLNVAVFAVVFRVLTQADVAWRDVLPGAILGGVVWMVLLVAGSLIVDRQIRDATEVYGFFAIVIGLLGWIGLATQTTLLAAELNVVLKLHLWPRSLTAEPSTTEPDRRVLAGEATEETARRDEQVDVRFDGADERKPPGDPRAQASVPRAQ